MNGNRKEYITLINVVSCIAVVFLHTNGCFWTFSTARYWKTANIIESLFYFAVPCFFMITGAVLMDFREKYTLKVYFQKRIKKTVIPFLCWSVLGILFRIHVAGTLDGQSLTPVSVYNGIVNTSFIPIYWFFITLFCLYLSLPLFSAVEKKARKEIFSYLALAGFIINFGVVLVQNTMLKELSWPFSIGVVSGALIYLVIGYLICTYELPPRWRKGIYLCSIAGFLIHCIGTYRVSMAAGEVVSTYKGYYAVPCIMYSVGIFVWLRYNSGRILSSRIIKRIVSFIAPYSFGIYLLQYFIYSSLELYLNIHTESILYRLGAPFVIIPAAILIQWVLKKIPVLKYIVP